jgi:hypothetical protein
MALLVLFFGILSCRKELTRIDISEFMNQYLTCDSIKAIVNGRETITVMGRETGRDISFDSIYYTIYSAPVRQMRYAVRYTKIYYWPSNVIMYEAEYFTIVYKSDKQLHLEHKDLETKNRTIYYYSRN